MISKELTYMLLDLYRGDPTNDDRPTLCHNMPVLWNDKRWIGATEAHHFILVPENADQSNSVPAPPINTVNLAAIIPQPNVSADIDMAMLKYRCNSIPLVSREITMPCFDCDGVGQFEHGVHDYDCKNCGGTGEIPSGKFADVKDDDVAFVFIQSALRIPFIETLIEAHEISGAKTCRLVHSLPLKVNVFEFDNGIIVGIMPFVPNDTQQAKAIKILESEKEKV